MSGSPCWSQIVRVFRNFWRRSLLLPAQALPTRTIARPETPAWSTWATCTAHTLGPTWLCPSSTTTVPCGVDGSNLDQVRLFHERCYIGGTALCQLLVASFAISTGGRKRLIIHENASSAHHLQELVSCAVAVSLLACMQPAASDMFQTACGLSDE